MWSNPFQLQPMECLPSWSLTIRLFVIVHANGQLHPANVIFPRIIYDGLSCAFSLNITYSSAQQASFSRYPGVEGRCGSAFSTNSTGPYRIRLKQINHQNRTTSSSRQHYTFQQHPQGIMMKGITEDRTTTIKRRKSAAGTEKVGVMDT
ncbi:uncharacterized protein LOC120431082 isoform X1 [Culex pipiens pallens]|uniref:uncharacterized protein LOC120431082 isoform X1 n=1 Tax=Culex pipiens pallens TaxID=42434 RepID=UPI0022AA8F43|nr:uncharacterized protein LOC120431082 isoform X1 [Culex pipiens pallens]